MTEPTLLVWEGGTEDSRTSISLVAKDSPNPEVDFVATQVLISSGLGTKTFLHLDGRAEIPAIPYGLLAAKEDVENAWRLRTHEEIEKLDIEVVRELHALKERTKKALDEKSWRLRVDERQGQSFFGAALLGDARFEASLQVSGWLLDGSSAPAGALLLRARATAELNLTGNWAFGGHDHVAKASGSLVLEVAVVSRKQPIDALVAFDVPAFPGFDLKLPRFKFGKLDFSGIDIPFQDLLPSITGFNSLPFGTDVTFAWQTHPTLRMTIVENGAVTLATPDAGKGELKHGQDLVLTVSNLKLHGTNEIQLGATIELSQADFSYQLPRFEEGPFVVAPGDVEAVLSPVNIADGQPFSLAIQFTFARIVIASRNDPSLVLAFYLVLKIEMEGSEVRTGVTAFKVIEPTQIDLLRFLAREAKNLKGPDLRFAVALPRFDVDVQDLEFDPRPLLERVGKMLAAAARWLADGIADTGRVLASVAESASRCLVALYDALSELPASGGMDHLAIEVRLDPRSWRLRQIIIMSAPRQPSPDNRFEKSVLGFTLSCSTSSRPALVIDLVEDWFGLVIKHARGASMSLSTDLWLDKSSGPAEPLNVIDTETGNQAQDSAPKLFGVTVTTKSSAGELVLIALQRNRVKLFQTFGASAGTEKIVIPGPGNPPEAPNFAIALASSGPLVDAEFGDVFDIKPHVDTAALQDKLLGLLPKPKRGHAGGTFVNRLAQYVQITQSEEANVEGGELTYGLGIKVVIERDKFEPEAKLLIAVDLRTLSMSLKGGDHIAIVKAAGERDTRQLLGFDIEISQKDSVNTTTYMALVLDLTGGRENFRLGQDARAELRYGKVSPHGRGMVFDVDTFEIGREGLDLEARITPEPVMLGGVDMPFRFESGNAIIRKSQFVGGSLSGAGQLPRDLVGEANAHIALSLAAREGNEVVIESAEAKLDKSADPIICESTRFKLTVSELGLDFVYEGAYHFYFQLTGSAVFNPQSGDGAKVSGLLKHLGQIELKLNKTPLTSDPRVLMRSISFQVKCDPALTTRLFDSFYLEARSFGFLPRCDKFDGAPAISIGGQAKLGFGDVVRTSINCHELLIAKPKSPSAFPQTRFDGLAIGLQFGSMVKAEGTAIAVDEKLPDLFRPDALPANVTSNGFLAAGKIDISGWASMSAAMGFLELRKEKESARPAFFFYGQKNKLSEIIPTPVGNLYLREVGFGFGYRYTLAGIAQAETASSPRELVQILDEVSKYQGSLDQIVSWQPTYDSETLTLAMRALFTVATASTSDQYRAEAEKDLPNPLLFDVVAAIRSDLTFLMNVRSWIAVNYADWVSGGMNAEFKSRPTQRGYLYISVPRQEFLGRFIADRKGFIGEHPKLPDALKKAIGSTDFSATLYIRPGLFHFELGWPFELGMHFGDPDGDFHLGLRGGLVQRIEDLALLTGIAFRGTGHVQFVGRVGGDSLGASVVARADFAIESKFLSYLSLRSPGESMLYGSMQLDITVHAKVEVWLRFKVFGRKISLSGGFSLSLSISVGLELVIMLGRDIGGRDIGGRAHVAIGVRAFGRSLSVGIGLSFNDDLLALARARVARYMELGLGTSVPPTDTVARREAPSPTLGPSRGERATVGDDRIQKEYKTQPPAPTDNPARTPDETRVAGREITASRFWAIIFPTVNPEEPDTPYYVLQLVPRDHTPLPELPDLTKSCFYASPKVDGSRDGYKWVSDDFDHKLQFNPDQGVPDGLFYLSNEGMVPVTKNSHSTNMELATAIIPSVGSQTLTLGDFLLELFMAPKSEESLGTPLALTEPSAQDISGVRAELGDNRDATAERLARAGRARAALRGQARQEAEIEERRSAALAAVVDSAAALANDPQTWSESVEGSLDARHFGLTYLASEQALRAMFSGMDDGTSPPKSNVTLFKRDCADPCEIQLFNPPSRHFRRAAPRLADWSWQRDATGIRLDWDLEPAWGRSRGVYDDPEFHLRHYRIVRRIANLKDGDWSQEFSVKAGAPIERDESKRVFLRAGMQFIDDFSLPSSLPGELRAFLCTQSTDPAGVWEKYQAGNDRPITVEYTVIPVDVAGTADVGSVFEITIDKPVDQLVSPREARLEVLYPSLKAFGCLPGASEEVVVPSGDSTQASLTLTLWPDIDPRKATQEPVPKPLLPLRLRLRSDRVVPGGQFGADAMSSALRRPDEAEMDLALPGDVDFQLEVAGEDEDTTGTITLVVAASNEGGEVKEFSLKVQRVRQEGETVAPNAVSELREELGLDGEQPLRSIRLFLRRDDFAKNDDPRPGPWRMLTVNLGIRGLEPRLPDDSNQRPVLAHLRRPRPVDAVLEAFEAPRHVEFAALAREDMEVESGRLHIVKAGTDAKLSDWYLDNPELIMERDLQRRVATRLTWHGQPRSLALANRKDAEDLHRVVGGYELFSLDPDQLPADFPVTDTERFATKVGRVTLLPASMRGLAPAEFGDLSRIETSYPSEACRMRRARFLAQADTMKLGQDRASRLAPWFSPAESTAILPEPLLRRSLICTPDDGLVDALFAYGGPERIVVVVEEWPKELPSINIWHELENPHKECGDYKQDKSGITRATLEEGAPNSALFTVSDNKPFRVRQVRRLLQALYLEFLDDDGAWHAKLLATPDLCAKVYVRVEAWRDRTPSPPVRVANERVAFDPVGSLHPVLADTLDLITYAPQKDGITLTEADGSIYRRYEVVRDTGPQTSAERFEAYVDEVPPQRDPYGWAALRTLGLAAGFRLYDTEDGKYVRGKDLLQKLDEAFARARSRYSDRDLGHPFVDLVTRPWGNAKLFWFDGGQRRPSTPELENLRDNELLATVQIALRPKPDRLSQSGGQGSVGKMPVQYFVLKKTEQARNFSIEFVGNEKSPRYDIVEVGDHFTQPHPIRVSGEEASTKTLKVAIPTKVRENEPSLFVRVILPAGEGETTPFSGLQFNENGATVDPPLEPVDLPAALENSTGPEAYGLFHDLDGKDWAFALFGRGETTEVEALKRLAYYAGRRFGRLSLPKATEQSQREELAGRIVGFWKAFLMHGAASSDDGMSLYYSLGTVADPGEWQLPVDADGRMSILHVESDRFGARRRYTVRPYGRFDALASATPTKLIDGKIRTQAPATGLTGALPTDLKGWNECWVDATLPRTEPVAKPVILSAVRLGKERALELVVAHTPDQTMASANRATQAGLAQHGIGVGFWREFAHPEWAAKLLPMIKLPADRAQAAFGCLDGKINEEVEPLELTLAAPGLEELRKRVPDAWLGSRVIRARCLPYFFRVHVLVHASAGIAVSEQTGTSFEEGFYELNFPWDEDHYAGKVVTTPPRYGVDRDEKTREVLLTFKIPTLRFIDCMSKADATIWFGEGGERMGDEFKPVVHLPDPGIGYRIVRELARPTGEALSWEPQIDLLAQAPPAEDDAQPPPAKGETQSGNGGLYVMQSLGTRLSPAEPLPEGESVRTISPSPPDEQDSRSFWHLNVRSRLGPPPVAEPVFLPEIRGVPVDDEGLKYLASFTLDPGTDEANKAWATVAPYRTLRVAVSKPPANRNGQRDWSQLKTVAEERRNALHDGWDHSIVAEAIQVLNQIIVIAGSNDGADERWREVTDGDQETHTFVFKEWIAGLPSDWWVGVGTGSYDDDWQDRVIRGRAETRTKVMGALQAAPESLQMAFHHAMRQAEINHDRNDLDQPYLNCPALTKALNTEVDGGLIDSVRKFDQESIVTLLPPPETWRLLQVAQPSERRKFGDLVMGHLEGHAGCSAALQVLSDWIDKGQIKSVAVTLPEHIESSEAFDNDLKNLAERIGQADGSALALVLWKPPTDGEFDSWRTTADDKAIKDRIADLVAEQLFGVGHRATLIVSKGAAFPEAAVFERQTSTSGGPA